MRPPIIMERWHDRAEVLNWTNERARVEVYEHCAMTDGSAWFWPASGTARGDHIYYANKPRFDGGGKLVPSEGFYGSTLNFRCSDGQVRAVQGPWHSNADSLFEATGVDLRNEFVGQVVLGLRFGKPPRGNAWDIVIEDVIHRDPPGTIGPHVGKRCHELAQEFADRYGIPIAYCGLSHGGRCSGTMVPRGAKA